jgi:hypothetical protein
VQISGKLMSVSQESNKKHTRELFFVINLIHLWNHREQMPMARGLHRLPGFQQIFSNGLNLLEVRPNTSPLVFSAFLCGIFAFNNTIAVKVGFKKDGLVKVPKKTFKRLFDNKEFDGSHVELVSRLPFDFTTQFLDFDLYVPLCPERIFVDLLEPIPDVAVKVKYGFNHLLKTQISFSNPRLKLDKTKSRALKYLFVLGRMCIILKHFLKTEKYLVFKDNKRYFYYYFLYKAAIMMKRMRSFYYILDKVVRFSKFYRDFVYFTDGYKQFCCFFGKTMLYHKLFLKKMAAKVHVERRKYKNLSNNIVPIFFKSFIKSSLSKVIAIGRYLSKDNFTDFIRYRDDFNFLISLRTFLRKSPKRTILVDSFKAWYTPQRSAVLRNYRTKFKRVPKIFAQIDKTYVDFGSSNVLYRRRQGFYYSICGYWLAKSRLSRDYDYTYNERLSHRYIALRHRIATKLQRKIRFLSFKSKKLLKLLWKRPEPLPLYTLERFSDKSLLQVIENDSFLSASQKKSSVA